MISYKAGGQDDESKFELVRRETAGGLNRGTRVGH